MSATVAVVGGGYGGIAVAQELDDVADVVLVDPKDSFVHNVASLRAVVDPAWADRMFFPYEGLLKRGTVLRDWAVSVDATGVRMASGRRLAADYIVIATGTTYPFPAKMPNNHAVPAKAKLRATSTAIAQADRVLLLGAGPVGLELAGEIAAAWPKKTVTMLDPAEEILSGGFISGFPTDVAAAMRDDLRRQLDELGVDLRLGASLRNELTTNSGETATFTAATWRGGDITADIWFRCFGRQPTSGCLSTALSGARRMDGRLTVTADLRIGGQPHIFAIGDVNATGAPETAVIAQDQGKLVAENIRALMDGNAELKAYVPGQPAFVIPLGTSGGSAYIPEVGLLDAAATAEIKGGDLFTGQYAAMFGLTLP